MPDTDFRSPRLYVDTPLAAGGRVPLDRNQGNYLGNVLRLGSGANVLVFNGRDGEWRAAISGRKRPEHLDIVAAIRTQDHLPDLHYVFAPLKHARLDYMVQKAVEMGVSALQPVLTRFTQVARVNSERMRANVIEAAEQCGILSIADGRGASRAGSLAEPARPAAPAGVLRRGHGNGQSGGRAGARARRLPKRDRRSGRSRRRLCRGRARKPARPARNPAACRLGRGSCAPIPRRSPSSPLSRPSWATGRRQNTPRLQFRQLVKPLPRSWSKLSNGHAKGLARNRLKTPWNPWTSI